MQFILYSQFFIFQYIFHLFNFLVQIFFLFILQPFKRFQLLNYLVWNEGLLIDYLQKVTVHTWIVNFLIYSSMLFNEKLMFDKYIFFFIDFFLTPFRYWFIFEFSNIGWMLFNFILILFNLILGLNFFF